MTLYEEVTAWIANNPDKLLVFLGSVASGCIGLFTAFTWRSVVKPTVLALWRWLTKKRDYARKYRSLELEVESLRVRNAILADSLQAAQKELSVAERTVAAYHQVDPARLTYAQRLVLAAEATKASENSPPI